MLKLYWYKEIDLLNSKFAIWHKFTNTITFFYKRLSVFLLGITVLFSSVMGYHSFLVSIQLYKDNFILTEAHNTVENLLSKNLVHYTKKNKTKKNYHNSYETKNEERESIPDTYKLMEILDKILPNYLSYKFSFNKQPIALSKNYTTTNNTTSMEKSYHIAKNLIFSLKLNIDQKSSYYTGFLDKLYKELFIMACASSSIIITLLHLFLKSKKQIRLTLSQLQEKLNDLNEANQKLKKSQQIDKYLDILFTKKATDIYVKQEYEAIKKQEEGLTVNEPPFPIILVDPNPEQIEIKALFEYLENYFTPFFTNISFNLTTEVDCTELPCTKEVFYQIIFSLVYNILLFMEDQSDKKREISISFKNTELIIQYNSFPLNEGSMRSLSEKLQAKLASPFILTCTKLFMSLINNGFEYNISTKNLINIIQIKFTRKKLQYDNSKVIYLKKNQVL